MTSCAECHISHRTATLCMYPHANRDLKLHLYLLHYSLKLYKYSPSLKTPLHEVLKTIDTLSCKASQSPVVSFDRVSAKTADTHPPVAVCFDSLARPYLT